MIDLFPESLEVLEHDVIAFVCNDHTLFTGPYATYTNNVVQSSLRIGFELMQDAEQICLFSLVTIFQAFVWINHVDMHFRAKENEIS